MNARSALFDLYGDHLRARGGRAPVASLVKLLAPLGVTAAAVRTSVSRMVRQGWLRPVPTASGPGYELTDRASRRLDEAAIRIYRTGAASWDDTWHLLVLAHVSERGARDRVRAGLTFLGYAPLDEHTWIAAYPSAEVDALLAADGVGAHRFSSELTGDAGELVSSTWDLSGLADAYVVWQQDAERIVARAGPRPDDELAFAVRSQLVHEWRKFLFKDPGLPRELLPELWPGEQAARFFDAEASRLLPAARRFVDSCLRANGVTP